MMKLLCLQASKTNKEDTFTDALLILILDDYHKATFP